MSRILSIGYVRAASPSNYDLQQAYRITSAKNTDIEPDPELLETGVDVGLMNLHIANAPERRELLGLKADDRYEIMVSITPEHLHSVGDIQSGSAPREELKAKYARFYTIDKGTSASGFTSKKMFTQLVPKKSLNMKVELTEIDNEKVDPNRLRTLLEDTSIGEVLDLSPVNPKSYITLASNVVDRIQATFGSDKAGDDELWDYSFSLEGGGSFAGSYRLRQGFYAIIEGRKQTEFDGLAYHENQIKTKQDNKEIDQNYLVFSIGKSV